MKTGIKFQDSRNDNGNIADIIKEKLNGTASGYAYRYDDDFSTVYLAGLHVDEKERRKGVGTKLLQVLENVGIGLGACVLSLWVKKDSWVHEWYKRNGYNDFKSYNGDENFVWMKKLI